MVHWLVEVIIAWVVLIAIYNFFLPDKDSVYLYPYYMCWAFGFLIALGGTLAQFVEQVKKK